MLTRLRDQLDTASDLTPAFISQLQLLDADLASGVLFDGRPANPEFAARHESLLAKADLRRKALEQAWARIKQHCDSLGRQIILFGSLLEGRVHAQSDLDLFLPETDLPEVTRRQLWNDIEDFAYDECVMADVHFADDYNSTFPDTIKVIFKDSIQPLRVLAERERP